MFRCPPSSTLFPYTTLFRSHPGRGRPARPPPGRRPARGGDSGRAQVRRPAGRGRGGAGPAPPRTAPHVHLRSEEHTSELQSHSDLVCRLLLEKKKKKETIIP